MKKEKSCGCIVFNDEKSVLLAKMNAGHWSFPKGHMEGTETEQETALRETLEETNVECQILDGFRETNTYSPFPGVIKDVIFFVAKQKKSFLKKQESEIAEIGFFSSESAKRMITYKEDLKIFDDALGFIEGKI